MSPFAPLNQNQFDPDLRVTLDRTGRAVMLSLNCHAVATVQSFDPSNMTVNATINYPMTFYRPDPVTGVVGPVSIDYPLLVQCPVILPQGGGFCFTSPIKTGDSCVILFNDRSLDNWFHSGQVVPLSSNRLHAFEDAMAFVGLRPKTNPVPNYDADFALIQDPTGQVQLGVGASKIRLKNSQFGLNTLMQELLTELENLTTAITSITVICASPGNPSSPPVNAAAIAAIGVQISATATKIGGLLE